MKTVLLHIGLHKTGTTTVQGHWKAHRGALLVAGIDYIPVGHGQVGRETLGHSNLSWSIIGDRRARAESGWPDVAAYLDRSPSHTHLISSEAFSLADDAGIARVADALKGCDVRIVVTYRNPVDLQQSHLREAACGWFPYDPDAFLLAGLGRPRFAYADLIRRWAAAFGADNVTPIYFEDAVKDLPAALLGTVGLDQALVGVPITRRNTSYGWTFLEANMACARLLHGALSPDLFRAEVASVLAGGRDLTETAEGDYIDQAQADGIVRFFASQIALLEARYGPAPDNYHVARRVRPIARRRWTQAEVTLMLRPMLMQRVAMLSERERVMKLKSMGPQLDAIKARRLELKQALAETWELSTPLIGMNFAKTGGRHIHQP